MRARVVPACCTWLFGGAGYDYTEARDGLVDVVGCGPGADQVNADRRDVVGADCEVVRR